MITLIDRSRSPLLEKVLSHDTVDALRKCLENNEKALIYLNRRGAFRAYICEDCSHEWMCPRCDIALSMHTTPSHRLICHHCQYETPIPHTCPKCHGARLKGIGNAIQEVERFLAKHLGAENILRLDSDAKKKEAGKNASILLATEYILREDIPDIDLFVVVTPEAELAIPEYDIEERVYSHIRILSGRAKQTVIETSAPLSPFIKKLTEGNYLDFISSTLAERKAFRYPPYTGLAYIKIKDSNENRLDDMTAKLKNKLDIVQKEFQEDPSIRYDRSLREKRAEEYIDTIVIRSDRMTELIAAIEKEILKNRGISLDVRGVKVL
ncbi:MAG: hypothetical protein ACOYN2_06935 [Patescibacteria group bacterium]